MLGGRGHLLICVCHKFFQIVNIAAGKQTNGQVMMGHFHFLSFPLSHSH